MCSSSSSSSRTPMARYLIVVTLLLSCCARTTMGQQTQTSVEQGEAVVIPYQILPLSVKMTVNDKGFDIESFQSRFEGIMALHLTNFFFQSLPDVNSANTMDTTEAANDMPLTKDIFDTVELRTRLAKTYVGAPGGESRIEASITGAAYFNFGNVEDAPAGNATYTRQVMTTTTLKAFQGSEYLKMIDLYLEDDILRQVTGLEIFVEHTLIAGGGFTDPNKRAKENNDSNSRHKAAIAASVVCVGLVAVGIILFLLVRKKKRKRSGNNSNSRRVGEGGDTTQSQQSPEQAREAASASASGAGAAPSDDGESSVDGGTSSVANSDVWMDEWTQKITSIPLRLAEKMSRPKPQSRPATRQSRKVWLFCIAEEDDVVEGEPITQTEEKDDEDDDDDDFEDYDDIELQGLEGLGEMPSGAQHEGRPFAHVDLAAASPKEYKPRLVGSHKILL